MQEPLYIDHQATTPVESAVLEAMEPFWHESFGNPHSSGHVVGWHSNAAVVKAKQHISSLIGANSDEIFFTSGATESNNLAAFSLSDLSRLHPTKKQVLVSPIDHKCIINSVVFWAQRYGLSVTTLKVDNLGYIDLDHLAQCLKTPTLFCSIGYVNNEVGTIQDIKKISHMVREADCILHSDAAQAPKTLDCHNLHKFTDLLSLSGHKIGAPQGIGVLYISANLQECITPLIQGGGQQQGHRSGTLPLPLCVGLGKACELLLTDESKNKRAHTHKLNSYFYDSLIGLTYPICLNGPSVEERHVGNLNVSFGNHEASTLLMALQPNVCASTGSACSSGTIETSHVLSAMGLSVQRCNSALRFSLNYNTTRADLDSAIKHLDECLREKRF